jgi:hypothetical protein
MLDSLLHPDFVTSCHQLGWGIFGLALALLVAIGYSEWRSAVRKAKAWRY